MFQRNNNNGNKRVFLRKSIKMMKDLLKVFQNDFQIKRFSKYNDIPIYEMLNIEIIYIQENVNKTDNL